MHIKRISSHSAFCSSGTDETDFVHAKEAKAKIPMVRFYFLTVLAQVPAKLEHYRFLANPFLLKVVIEFYEEKLAWFTGEESQEEEE